MRRISNIIILIILVFTAPAAAQNVGAVPDIRSPEHNSDMPSSASRIKVTWGIPDGDPYGYFVLFDTNPAHTFALPNPDGNYVTGRGFTGPDFASSQPDDVAYYFHIAGVDGKGDIGPTVTAGPYRIDVVPPSDIGVTAPEFTSVRTVTLTLRAEGASSVCLSSTGHGTDSRCEDFSGQTEWELTSGGGEKTVYVRFSDPAGNTADTSSVITLISGDADRDGETGLRDAVLILRMLAGHAEDVNPDADMSGDGKVGIGEVIYILRRVSDEEALWQRFH